MVVDFWVDEDELTVVVGFGVVVAFDVVVVGGFEEVLIEALVDWQDTTTVQVDWLDEFVGWLDDFVTSDWLDDFITTIVQVQ